MNQYLAMLRQSVSLQREISDLYQAIQEKEAQLQGLAGAILQAQDIPGHGCFLGSEGEVVLFEVDLNSNEKPYFSSLYSLKFLNESGV